jgi:hypothetical protein
MSDCRYCHNKNNFDTKFCEVCGKQRSVNNINIQLPLSSAINFNDPMIDAKIEKYRRTLNNPISTEHEKTDVILSLCDLKRKGSIKAKMILERFSRLPIENHELQKLAANSN